MSCQVSQDPKLLRDEGPDVPQPCRIQGYVTVNGGW
jgi:hypothetical protein